MIHFFSLYISCHRLFSFFFFNDTAPTEIYTLSLHDALPISLQLLQDEVFDLPRRLDLARSPEAEARPAEDRKSTRLNSSHQIISYAVFCLKKKKKKAKLPQHHQPNTYTSELHPNSLKRFQSR